MKTIAIVDSLTWIDELQRLSEQQALAVLKKPRSSCTGHRLSS
jgi:hypothetical protein